MNSFVKKIFAISFSVLGISFATLRVYAAKSTSKSASDEDLKKQILSTADLNGVSADELLANDDADDSENQKNQKKQTLSAQREVFYTKDLETFYKKHFNHEIKSQEDLDFYFTQAVNSADEFSDEYSKNVHLARCHYFYGLQLQEDFDLSAIRNLDLTDSSDTKNSNELAAEHYDEGIKLASSAYKIKNGSDALSIWAHCISANCTAKNVLYILGNGLKVRSYARRAVKIDYSNGTAHFLASAQDAYAPKPFNKAVKARKEVLSYLNDDSIRMEEFDLFNMYYTVAYTYFLKKRYSQATKWFQKCLEIYPNNISTNRMLENIQELK